MHTETTTLDNVLRVSLSGLDSLGVDVGNIRHSANRRSESASGKKRNEDGERLHFDNWKLVNWVLRLLGGLFKDCQVGRLETKRQVCRTGEPGVPTALIHTKITLGGEFVF